MSIQELFSDKQYVANELIRMREAWGIRSTFTRATIDASYETLSFMLLYAPSDMSQMVQAHIYELGTRERMMLLGPHRAMLAEREKE